MQLELEAKYLTPVHISRILALQVNLHFDAMNASAQYILDILGGNVHQKHSP